MKSAMHRERRDFAHQLSNEGGLVREDSDTTEKGSRIAASEIERTVTAAAVAMLRRFISMETS